MNNFRKSSTKNNNYKNYLVELLVPKINPLTNNFINTKVNNSPKNIRTIYIKKETKSYYTNKMIFPKINLNIISNKKEESDSYYNNKQYLCVLKNKNKNKMNKNHKYNKSENLTNKISILHQSNNFTTKYNISDFSKKNDNEDEDKSDIDNSLIRIKSRINKYLDKQKINVGTQANLYYNQKKDDLFNYKKKISIKYILLKKNYKEKRDLSFDAKMGVKTNNKKFEYQPKKIIENKYFKFFSPFININKYSYIKYKP